MRLATKSRYGSRMILARAVRTPSIFEDSVLISIPIGLDTITVLEGNHDMDSESLIAYELGYRIRPFHSLTFDLAGFFNDIDDNKSGTREIEGYYRCDARLGWRPTPNLEFSVAGQNLLVYQDGDFVDEHQEYKTLKPDSGLIERSVYAQVACSW